METTTESSSAEATSGWLRRIPEASSNLAENISDRAKSAVKQLNSSASRLKSQVSAKADQVSGQHHRSKDTGEQDSSSHAEEEPAWRRRISGISAQISNSLYSAAPSLQRQQVHPAISLSSEVAAALQHGQPVVALESTIIAHGMPFPQNLETAQAVEAVVRAEGAVPATCAILEGRCCVGLSEAQLHRLASRGASVPKTARRDLPLVIAQGLDGATTVSATMVLAARAGIRIFVTGGIGGVHRGAETSMDISSDLTELARTPVAVVCAGVKSVLDIPRTLEYLETQGVSVAALGTDEFPAFFTRRSGCAAPLRVDSIEQAAALIRTGLGLNLGSGTLIGAPIPEEQAAEGEKTEKATQQALQEMHSKGIQGHQVTPFLLKRIQELTGGESLSANIALIKHNAKIGAQIAVAL